MGRKRDEANSRLGDHVQRRSGGGLELRFPIPHDVRPAFLDANGRPRFQIIRSLGTKDIRLANAKADALRTSIRADIMKVRQARSSGNLDGFLRDLFDEELASFQRQTASDAKTVLIRPWSSLLEERQGGRSINTRALLSADPKERLATAGWAAELYLRLQGRDPDGSPEFQEIVDRCANVLAEALIAQNELAAGCKCQPLHVQRKLQSVQRRRLVVRGFSLHHAAQFFASSIAEGAGKKPQISDLYDVMVADQ